MNFKSCGAGEDDDYNHCEYPSQRRRRRRLSATRQHNNHHHHHQISTIIKRQLVGKLSLSASHYADEAPISPSHRSASLSSYLPALALNSQPSGVIGIKRSFGSASLYWSLYLLLASSIQLLPAPCLAKVTTAAHQQFQYEELIEGRLDTSQLCGTRYPTAAAAAANQALGANNLLYIVGGDEVEDEQFWPWSVAIYELDPLNGHREFICSGSLISDKFILTAAHCIQQSRFDILGAHEVFLKIAAVRLDDERASFYRVSSVHIHPEYSVDRKANDIALLRLAPGQRLPLRARPICLPSTLANRIDFTDQQVTIIGWGKTSAMHGDEPTRLVDIGAASSQLGVASGAEIDGPAQEFDTLAAGAKSAESNAELEASARDTQTNDTLLQAEVRVTNTDQCNRNYSKLEISWLNIDEHFLCASDPHGKRDACQGDSGGPLMWNNQQQQQHPAASEKWYQLGLVSFGHGCANSQFPGVYTRISYYMPWILKTINVVGPGGQSQVAAAGRH